MTALTTELRDLVDEALLLRRPEEKARAYSDAQHVAIRSCVTAAALRRDAAASLRDADQLGSAYTLYCDAAFLSAIALQVADGSRAGAGGDRPLPAHLTEKLQSRAGAAEHLPALVAALSPDDPLAFDALEMDDALARLTELERALGWIAREFEPRTVREIRTTRAFRLTLAVLLPLLGIALIAYWLMHVSNVALRKTVTSSGLGFNSLPIGAVDGNKDGTFGFHTTGIDTPWMVIDLEGKYRLSEIRVFGRGDCCFDQSIPVHLSVSEDGADYRRLETRTTPFSESDPWVVRGHGERIRYVRIERDAPGFLVLSEVEVDGR